MRISIRVRNSLRQGSVRSARERLLQMTSLVVVLLLVAPAVARAQDQAESLEGFEKAIAADPENLRIAADYRQLAIAVEKFDRSIDFLEKLARRKGSGPNLQISLALAYVDKVPTSGDIRRLYLGRDAMGALTRSLRQRPSVLAYYVRGVINLFYNNFIFKRIPRGIEDLQQAIGIATEETPAALVARAYAALGDGYWKLNEKDKARDVWRRGAERYPGHDVLDLRLDEDEQLVARTVSKALYAPNRVDTSLRDALP